MKQTSISTEFLELLTTMPFEMSINKLLERGVKHIRTQFNTRDTYTLDTPDAVTVTRHEVVNQTVEVWGTGHFQKARNPYVCDECGGKITPKQRYMKRTDHTNMEVCQYCLSCAATELKWATTYNYQKKEESPMEQQQEYGQATAITTQTHVDIWQNPGEIKRLFAQDLSEQEFQYFMGLAKAFGANPFNKEIWAVKYGGQPAQVFLGRDFYRRVAEEQLDYDGHYFDAVYERDVFSVKQGVPEHSYVMKNRGVLIGAYCVVYHKRIKIPYYIFCEIEEYMTYTKTGQVTKFWKQKPATMIKKVAEAQGLRLAFQGVFKGTYSEAEQWENPSQQPRQEDLPQEEQPPQEVDPALIDQIKVTLEKLAVFEPDAWEETYQRFQDAQKKGFPPRRYKDGTVEPYVEKDFQEFLDEYQQALTSIEMKLAAIEKAESMPAGVNPLDESFDDNPYA